MTGRNIVRLAQNAQRSARSRVAARLGSHSRLLPALNTLQRTFPVSRYGISSYSPRSGLSTSAVLRDLQPTIDPAHAVAADIDEALYHELADDYLEMVLSKFEELQDEGEELDVEYQAGVMTINFPSGTYVVNKQPPNKQIWLSSPVSGPKRYDWVIVGDGQEHKQGTGRGEWIYLKDGTSMNALFENETGIDLTMPIQHYGG